MRRAAAAVTASAIGRRRATVEACRASQLLRCSPRWSPLQALAPPALRPRCSAACARRPFSSSAVVGGGSAEAASGSGGGEDGVAAVEDEVALDEEDEAWVESRLEAADDSAQLPSVQQRIQDEFGADARRYVAPSFAERLASLPQLYTATAVAAHSAADANKYFMLSEEQQRLIPPQLAGGVEEELRLTGGYLQVHEAYIPLVERLARVKEARGRAALLKPIGVHGSHGAGKSALLAYLSLWARERGWLVVAVRADEFTREKMGWIRPSDERSGVFDQPLYTQHWLAQLAQSQPALLERIALKGQYPFAAAAGCRSLLDLLHVARDDASQATAVLYAAVAELRRCVEVPVLVAMDNINVWDAPSDFVDPDSRTARSLPARRLALVDALSTFQHVAPAMGAAVFATTAHASPRQLPAHFNLRKVRPVLLQSYSHSALQHALVHYHVSGVLLAEVDAQLVSRIRMASGAVPNDVKQAALHL